MRKNKVLNLFLASTRGQLTEFERCSELTEHYARQLSFRLVDAGTYLYQNRVYTTIYDPETVAVSKILDVYSDFPSFSPFGSPSTER